MSDDEFDYYYLVEIIVLIEVFIFCLYCGVKCIFDFMQIEEDDFGCFLIGDEYWYDRCEGCDEMVDYGVVWL